MSSPVVTLEYKGRIAIITIANEKKANALTQDQYYLLASHLRDVATHDEVFITILTGKGTCFSLSNVEIDNQLRTHNRTILLSVRIPQRLPLGDTNTIPVEPT
jgi:hypothetical protein